MADFTGKVMSQEGNKQLSQDDAPYRIKSRDFAITSGEHECIQSKPNMIGTGTAGITCFNASPRFASGIAGGKIVGYVSNPILKTTALLPGGNCGPMRCFEGKLETGVHSTRIVTMMAVLHAMSNVRGTVSQGPTVILATPGEYKAWESVMELDSTESMVWNASDTTVAQQAGYFKVVINGSDRYVMTYSTGPSS